MRAQSEIFVNRLCTTIFCVFAFFYLLCFQNERLAFAQDYLSHGATTYKSFIGALIITITLFLLSLLTAFLLKKSFLFLPAIYHLPSALVLGAICDINPPTTNTTHLFGSAWIWGIVILVFLWIAYYIFRGNIIRFKSSLVALLVNLFAIFILLVLAVSMGTTDNLQSLHPVGV